MDASGGEPAPTDEFQQLTYGQIGERLGVTADAARQLVRRKGWSRSRPNTIGQPVIVTVPTEALTDVQPADDRRDPTDDAADFDDADRRSDLSVVLRLAIDTVRQQLERAEQRAGDADKRADTALALADRLGAKLADAGDRADRAEEHARLADARAQAAQEAAETLRQADADRRGRGRWARLRRAWRGE